MKKEKIDKAIKPSQRKSITCYSARFAHSKDVDSRAKKRKLARIIIIAVAIAVLIYIGFFITDILIRISEIPPTDLSISTEAIIWNSSLLIHG